MKAIVITEPGEPSVLQVQERPMPFCGLGEVLIQVKAAGVNRPDVAQRQGLYPAPPGASLDIPGLEVSGTILECGAQVNRWSKGDPVCALLTGGGYAEFVAVPAGQCLPIPENLSFEEAASLPETVFTVWHNVFQRAGLASGETLLVHGGSSGIGITAIQIAAAKGAKVVVTVGTEEKGIKCMELGAAGYVNYKELDFEAALLEEGVDVVLDMVGGSYFDKNLNILRPDGRMVYINSMQGNLVKLNIARMMQKRITISGSTLRSRDTEFKSALAAEVEQHVWPLLVNGQFKPVIYQTFAMAEASQAHALLESSSHTGKIVLVNT